MIKLNNKNITYVALADTNNSIKAPKEIWYADTNNSVKLVYRRKDALIEGEDYEKYHWLKGDDSAYIQGIAFDLWNNHFNARIGKNERLRYFNYYVQSTTANFKIEVDNNISIPYLLAIFRNANNGVHIDELRPYSAMPDVVDYDFYIDNSTFYCNRDGVIHTNSGTNIAIESNWTSIQPMIKSAKISYIREVLPNDTYRSNLTPCKLLKPVPKWLDANGIRRQVGECGMIDLVSGKFYGNVANAGTFSVENYYERKEWLVGDGSAYIDTGHNVNEDLDYETKAHLLPNTYLFWYRSGKPYIDQTMVVRSNTSTYQCSRIAKNSVDVRISDIENVVVQWNNNKVSINGVDYIPNDGAVTFNHELYLFYGHLADTPITNYSTNNVKCTYFRFLDSNRNYIQNLIPCTLTMDLPASMDANNIARTKGTSGMWDLVSDRFYGNVANSGTFKAVNLAEGVDYEVHQWLVAEIYPQTTMMLIPVNSSNFSFIKENGNIYANLVHFVTSGYTYYTQVSGMDVLSVWDNTNGVFVMSKTVGSTMEFNSTSQGLSVNNTNITQYGFPVSRITFQTSSGTSNIVTTKTSSITVDSIERYIPVKLLKSIPSKYDANGIARQAGECGMYDTVNDVFYGNVASSGTFSVSDDS